MTEPVLVPYKADLRLHLTELDPDLTGFDGDGSTANRSVDEAERSTHATHGRAASHACITVLDLESPVIE